jgi:hypothetical protein
MFGDDDLVAIYRRDTAIDREHDEITLKEEKAEAEEVQHIEPTLSRQYTGHRIYDPPNIFY